jgi:hypothetical protein
MFQYYINSSPCLQPIAFETMSVWSSVLISVGLCILVLYVKYVRVNADLRQISHDETSRCVVENMTISFCRPYLQL